MEPCSCQWIVFLSPLPSLELSFPVIDSIIIVVAFVGIVIIVFIVITIVIAIVILVIIGPESNLTAPTKL